MNLNQYRISYNLRWQDWLWWSLNHNARLTYVHFLFTALAIVMAAQVKASGDIYFLAILAILLFLILEVSCLVLLVLQSLISKDRTILTQYTITLVNEGLQIETSVATSRVLGRGLGKIVEVPGLVAIYLGKSRALVIPNRAFSSKAERAQFLLAINARRTEA